MCAVGEGVKDIVNSIGGPLPSTNCHAKKTVIRTLMLACPNMWDNAEWGSVLRTDLQAWVPDETGVLELFPVAASAESISMPMFGRPDSGLLVSMWGCLWKQVPCVLAKVGMQPEQITPESAGTICEVATAM